LCGFAQQSNEWRASAWQSYRALGAPCRFPAEIAFLNCVYLLGIRSPRPLEPDLTTRLAAEQVYVSVRGQFLRVSPHDYNTESDIQRFVAALGTLG